MWSVRERELIQKYTAEIVQQYIEASRVHTLATVRGEQQTQAPDFKKIGKRFVIPREYFEPDHVIIMHPFADFVATSEFQYIIDTLKQSTNIQTRLETSPNYQAIDTAIQAISNLTQPNFIIVPVAFFVDLHMTRRPSSSVVAYENSFPYYFYGSTRLRILWSNKYIKLNEIIIGNSRDNLWLFKPRNADRLGVEFSEREGSDVELLVETTFKFVRLDENRISVIAFPDRLCRI